MSKTKQKKEKKRKDKKREENQVKKCSKYIERSEATLTRCITLLQCEMPT